MKKDENLQPHAHNVQYIESYDLSNTDIITRVIENLEGNVIWQHVILYTNMYYINHNCEQEMWLLKNNTSTWIILFQHIQIH